MRSPTLDEIEAVFLANYDPADRDNPDRLRNALAVVREAIVMGPSRAHIRAKVGQRARVRKPARSRRDLVTADADVLERVASFTRVSVTTLLAQDRSQSSSRARFMAMWALKRGRRRSTPEVGVVLGRTHSAVINGVRKVDAEVAADPALGEMLRGLAA